MPRLLFFFSDITIPDNSSRSAPIHTRAEFSPASAIVGDACRRREYPPRVMVIVFQICHTCNLTENSLLLPKTERVSILGFQF